MTFLNILSIITRILYGLIAIGCLLSICLHEKHRIFKSIFEITGSCVVAYGIGKMFVFAVLGF